MRHATAPFTIVLMLRNLRSTSLRLLAGDISVFAVFALIGTVNHHEDGAAFVRAFFPFSLCWVVVSSIAAINSEARRPSPVRLLATWLTAAVSALLVRWLLLDRPVAFGFAFIAIVFQGFLLLGWRRTYVELSTRDKTPTQR
jgi:hypothetical protein